MMTYAFGLTSAFGHRVKCKNATHVDLFARVVVPQHAASKAAREKEQY